MSKIVLNDVFKDWLTHGIISHLTLNFNVPWKNTVEGSILDLEYHGNRSGNKIISPLVEKLITKDGISLSNETKLCGLIYTKNITRWNELWKSLELYSEFNPLDNVNEITDHTVTKTGTDSNVFNKGTETDTLTASNTTNIGSQTSTNNIGEQTITQESDIAGFNSSYQDANKTTTNNGSHTDTSNISERSDSSSDTSSTVSGEREDNSTTTYNTTETTSIRRHGNIGVTTSGQLIDDFRRVVDWQFFDTVFNDIDKIVVISTYGELHDSLDGLVINSDYVLNPATKDTLGGIKVGDNLTITADGRLSADVIEPNYPVTSVNGQTGDVEINIPVTSVNGQTGNVIIDIPEIPVNVLIVPRSEVTVNITEATASSVIPDSSNWTTDITEGIQSIIDAYNSNKTSDKKTVVYILDGGDLIEPDYQLNNDNFGILTFDRVGLWTTTPSSAATSVKYRYVIAVNGTLGKMYCKYYSINI